MKLTKTSIGAVIAAGALMLSACGSSDGTSSTSGAAASGTGTQSTAATTATTATTTASKTTDPRGGGSTDIASAKVGDEIDAIALGQAMQKVFVDGATGHMKMDMGGSISAEGDFKVVKGKQDLSLIHI